MRITVWNINGLRTLKGYQPWFKLPDWEACLEHLGADIACFQETKMTRKQLTESMCILPSYHSFFNFHPAKGYSGTVTYVRKSVAIPLKAEQGITGRLVPAPEEAIGYNPVDTRDDVEPKIWTGLDDEGRAVVLDLGMFVLFNVYAPNETGPERLEYKMSYYKALAERADRLIAAGRQVMIVGDMNIIRDPIDHCDPEQSIKEHGWSHFHQHPARSWFTTFLAPKGKFHDVGRMYHPQRRKMFTCWNTLIDARPANYGVRLDYTLVTDGLLPWIKAADIQPDIYGSDHCPIYIDLHDERDIDGTVVKLKDLMHGAETAETRPPPPLAACFYDEFSGKQRKLASFFSAASKNKGSLKQSGLPSNAAPLSPSPVASQDTTATTTTAGPSSDTAVAQQDSVAQPQNPTSGADEGASLADALFALHSQQEGVDVVHSQSQSQPTMTMTMTMTAAGNGGASSFDHACSVGQNSADSKPSIASTSDRLSLSQASTASSQPKPASLGKRPASPAKSSVQSRKQAKVAKGQTSLQSFFGKPKQNSSRDLGAREKDGTETVVKSVSRDSTGVASAAVAGGESRAVVVGDSSNAPKLDFEDGVEDEDSIQDFPDLQDSQSYNREPCTTPVSSQRRTTDPCDSSISNSKVSEQTAAERVDTSLAWGAIFSPLPPPACRLHNEACRAWTVNKAGPNHGRKFWLCSRPVGPGYEKSGRARGDVNPEFRCNFFLWDSDRRSESARSKGLIESLQQQRPRPRQRQRQRRGLQDDPDDVDLGDTVFNSNTNTNNSNSNSDSDNASTAQSKARDAQTEAKSFREIGKATLGTAQSYGYPRGPHQRVRANFTS
ncbi:DNase I-like protein [Testicularia cyperi]|uniref:DNA-(apurinic or apyrimidinic site) endonuclease 2 n=1 Tax=Testicularia cyperi TaxID=1882483 RepID=A0A317XVQ5_9BASI|nr:DNase I-like protein [Testicularia cyperi]